MNNSNEERLKIAVFVDFDNIAIGVKQSLNRNFDIGTVLEAIKEKGQVISKIAYGDWKRAEDYSKAMTQHAVQMVQRNLTPGGDKNGADIALALDALEMAFTRNHINAFVIVGGDSDFIALVEKLKQYDKTVFVVGGRAFTSVILQKNCHEFISYENLIGIQSQARKSSGKAQISSTSALGTAMPLIRRALKILSDREVSPQLGLLKSTLLQLDSTFSERDYGVSSFRDFTQRLADAGYVKLKQVDRSLLVELKETREERFGESEEPQGHAPDPEPENAAAPDQPATEGQASDAVQALELHLRESKVRPHWPMYLRTFKQFLRSLQPQFDERQYGFSSIYELARQAQRDGLLRIERNRQGILRIFPTDRFLRTAQHSAEPIEESISEETAAPEFDAPSREPDVSGGEPGSELQRETAASLMDVPRERTELQPKSAAAPSRSQLETEPPPTKALSQAKPEAEGATESSEAEPGKPAEKPKPRTRARKKTATAASASSGKGTRRKTRSTGEKTKRNTSKSRIKKSE
jgi:uncharacterized LabA/DUF88 family protein